MAREYIAPIVVGILAFIIISGMYWYFFYEPDRIISEVKTKIKIIEPYDEYVLCWAFRDDYGWWSVGIDVMDVENGTEGYNFFRYNENTHVLKANPTFLKGIELR